MAASYDFQSVPEALVRKIGALPRARVAEVEDFVDFIARREERDDADRMIARAASDASAPALARIWSNPEDDVYDAL